MASARRPPAEARHDTTHLLLWEEEKATVNNSPGRLHNPTITDIRDALGRTLREDFELAWKQACTHVGIDVDRSEVTDEQFDRLIAEIATIDPLSHVMAMSWRIRRTASRKLAALGR